METQTEEGTSTSNSQESEAAAQAEFAAGFNSVAKKDGLGQQPKVEESEAAGEPAAAATETPSSAAGEPAATTPAPDPWDGVPTIVREQLESLAKLPEQLRSIHGHIGGLKSQLNSALATAKAAAESRGEEAPSQQQIDAAMSDPKAMERLLEDYPELIGPVANELKAVRAELAKRQTPTIDLEAIKRDVAQTVRAELVNEIVEEKHPNWVSTVNTDDFKGWLQKQPQDVAALAQSSKTADAIKLLDRYTEAKKTAPSDAEAAERERQRREKRLRSNITPQGVGEAGGTTLISDEEAFNQGFRKAFRKA